MICYICDTDNWKSTELSSVGDLRVCCKCGNVAYKIENDDEQKMRDFYRKTYRPDPNVGNLITTNHKLQYIRVFLREYFQELGDRKIFFGDIGCATGYIMSFFKRNGHKVTGCEYTLSFRRFCEKWYGIPVPEDLYRKKPYDMLCLYHVLEHMVQPDKKLVDYTSLLKPDGRFFISTPQWLDTLEEASGSPIVSFDALFPKPHINVFTEISIKNIFAKVGLEVVKEDHIQYGQTYLLKKGEARTFKKEDTKEVIEKLVKTKEAINLYISGNPEEAVSVWPKFPEAWVQLLINKNMKDTEKQKEIYEQAEKFLKTNCRWRVTSGFWNLQHKRYQDAIKDFSYVMQFKPNEDIAILIGNCFMEMNNFDEAFPLFEMAHNINPQKWVECMNKMAKCASSTPTWDERALMEIGKKAINETPPLEFKDPDIDENE